MTNNNRGSKGKIMGRRSACIAPLALGLMAAGPAPLASDQGGVVGGWTDPAPHQVRRLYVARIEDRGGCLRFADGPRFEIEDHLTANKPVMWKVHRVTPGRYAIWAVGWGDPIAPGYLATGWYGASRQEGALVTFEVTSGAVTDIGVWRVTSPYFRRYTVEGQDSQSGHDAAEALAAGVGPLTSAQIVRAEVALPDGPCPAPPAR